HLRDRARRDYALSAATPLTFSHHGKMNRLFAPLALLTIAASAAGAQTFPTDDAMLRRIWSVGMDSSRLWDLGQALLDSVGPRLTGSPNLRAGNDWLVARYREWGI